MSKYIFGAVIFGVHFTTIYESSQNAGIKSLVFGYIHSILDGIHSMYKQSKPRKILNYSHDRVCEWMSCEESRNIVWICRYSS